MERRRPPHPHGPAALRILVVDENPERSAEVVESLAAEGHEIVGRLRITDDLRQAIARHRPDIVVVDLESPYRDYLEDLIGINRENPRPIAMFVGEEDRGLSARALETGVSVYAVDGLSPKLVHSVLGIALAQFERFRGLQEELERSRTALDERKVIERAKGLLMSARGLSEEQAHKAMRKMAMDQGRKLREIAEAVLALADVIKR